MVCAACGSSMCWKCGRAINGYDHFNASNATCALFAIPGEDDGRHVPGIRYVPNRDHRLVRKADFCVYMFDCVISCHMSWILIYCFYTGKSRSPISKNHVSNVEGGGSSMLSYSYK